MIKGAFTNMSEKIYGAERFPKLPVGPLGVISLEGSRDLAEKVNEHLMKWRAQGGANEEIEYTFPGYDKQSFILESRCPRFSNGEGKGVIAESVRGYDLFIFCDVGNYACTYKMYDMQVPMSPDDHYQDLKRIIAATAGQAKRINVIMPLLYEGRQHRRSSRESLDCAVMLQELIKMGVDNLVTFDAHDPRLHNAIPLNGFENIMPTYQMLKAMLHNEPDIDLDNSRLMVVSPDEGALDRNIYYASVMGLDLGMFYKRRDYTRIVNGRNPIIAHEYLGADVAGKDIIIADDMIASGDSALDIARCLKKANARNIYIMTTFALFTEGLDRFNKAYEEGLFHRVYATNLTYVRPELKQTPWFCEVDASKYLAYVLAAINHDYSLNRMMNPYDKISKLLHDYKAQKNEDALRIF